jgi:hypothetical protein
MFGDLDRSGWVRNNASGQEAVLGGLFCISKRIAPAWPELLASSRRQYAEGGFAAPYSFETSDWVIDHYAKIDYPCNDRLALPDGGFAVAVGTFILDGCLGAAALQRLHDAADPHEAVARARGHFIVVLHRDGRTILLPDRLAARELLIDPARGCVATSLLALARLNPAPRLRRQEVYEFVFSGVTLGNATLLDGVQRLGVNEWICLESGPTVRSISRPICPPERSGTRDELVARNLDGLLRYAGELGALFGDRIRLALSGGYDSRLLLALFRRVGVIPQLFVYGPPTHPDVVLARRIAAAEGLALQHIEKAALVPPLTPDTYAQVVARNFAREGGLLWGGVFQSDVEVICRPQRTAGGALHVSGGGGEVFRNFFNLPDRPISLRGFVWNFYSRYDPSACTARFDPRAYEEAIGAKIRALLDLSGDRLRRQEAECLYPYLRCRSWFGPENSVNGAYGYSVLPFFEARIVDEALRIPVRKKHFGDFEAAMIRSADPALARHPSTYGHDFTAGTPLPARLRDLLGYLRPLALRRRAFRIRTKLHRPGPRPPHLTPAYIGRVIDPALPRMSRYFHPAALRDNQQFARLCTLEYFCQEIGARDE